MNRLSRSTALKTAAVISLLLGIAALGLSIPALARGASQVQTAAEPPYVVVVIAFAFAVMRIVGSVGVWQQQRWGIVLTLIANALDALSAIPGILFAPSTFFQIAATLTVVLSILVIVLCLWRDREPASAPFPSSKS
jgi:uncharacterized membrane protein (DUF2068 family)